MNTPLGIASLSLASTPLPDLTDTVEGHLPGTVPDTNAAIYLRQFLLNCQQAVKANEVARHQMLKDQLHALVMEQFGEALDSLVAVAADELYSRLCAVPDEEIEEDTPDPGDFDLPAPEPE